MTAALNILAVGLLAVLLVFSLRRMVLLSTLLFPQTHVRAPASLPSVLLLIPARDETRALPGLFESLDSLDYPSRLISVVLVDDGSTDDTAALMEAAARSRSRWQVLKLPRSVGKAQALNEAVSQFRFGEVVYVFDADHRPQSNCLRRAAAAFDDPRIAGVTGRTIISNPLDSPAAFYSAVESMVHQLITMRGKDVLGLGPALLGSNNGCRRAALAAAGGFRAGAFLEDSDMTLALHRAGYTTRFVPEAVSYHRAPSSLSGYLRQHVRWGRGFNEVARAHLAGLLKDERLALPMRIELALFSVGYLDRLALLLGLILSAVLAGAAASALRWGIAFSLALPFIQIIAALLHDRAPLRLWLRLPWVPVFFALDIGAAAWAMLATALNLQRVWHKTERA